MSQNQPTIRNRNKPPSIIVAFKVGDSDLALLQHNTLHGELNTKDSGHLSPIMKKKQ